ncbi:hypothetical protein LXA43DRAFT_855154, partial [Ganoderma leucocontextum]
PMCRSKTRITQSKKAVVVTIADTCPGCAVSSMVLRLTVFKKLAPVSVGSIQGIKWT